MSRSPHQPTSETRQLARSYAGMGMRRSDIALLLDISEKTLRLYYSDELEEGLAEANAAVVSQLHKLIREGNTSATIFADKCGGCKSAKPKKTNPSRNWAESWNLIAGLNRKAAEHCDAQRCAEAVVNLIEYRLCLPLIHTASDEKIKNAIIQVERHLKIVEQEVETLVPIYEF